MAQVQTPDAAKSNAAEKAGEATGPKGAPLQRRADDHQVTDEQRKAEELQAQQNLAAQFKPTEQTTPAAHDNAGEDAEAVKRKAFEEAVQALANSMGVQVPALTAAPAPATKQRTPRPEKQVANGVTRPSAGTETGKIWDAADEISASKNGQGFASIAELRQRPELRQTNEHTLKTQYARWRTYHGLKGRQPGPAAPQASPEGQYDEALPNTPQRRVTDQQAA